ncbi:cell adhesion molecule Dscam1-like, partial [Halyomorpha halys]|uniref:cell adhesion molecule Dscam1-like n=1 Tax=Halyomorpha halys TaxID=286706 RepID=UPI0034D2E349
MPEYLNDYNERLRFTMEIEKEDGKYQMLPTGELLVRRLDDADVYRSYQCRAVNTLTGQTLLSLRRVQLHVTDSLSSVTPRIAPSSTAVYAKKEGTIVLPCFSQGNPPPTYIWKKEGEKRVEVGGRVITANEALIIHRAELTDSGSWTCIANNTAGQQTKTTSLH